MYLWKAYLRWRHSRGFGVHSPYAYRFVTDVLHQGEYGYYAYHTADHLLTSPQYDAWEKRKEIYFLIRLIIFLGSKRLLCNPKNIIAQIAAKSLSIQLMNISGIHDFYPHDLLVIDSGFYDENVLKKALKTGIPVFATDPLSKIRKILESPLERGLLMASPRRLFLIPRSEMAYISYDVNML